MSDTAKITLILGGAKSGKTTRALALAEAAAPERIYIATAQAFDDEMAAKIAAHQRERGSGWQTIEAPLDLTTVVGQGHAAVLVDCLTLWLSNLMHHKHDLDLATEAFLGALSDAPGPMILVSNEVGMGLVPETSLGRRFRDAQGRLNQRVAAAADRVEFVAAGLPLVLKG
ncbi:MAG: bifunctional adenosylcobinamide kinase/adenosylcobinamide-phosphate guanylyltransferase [Pseudomonadota bacterium]